MKTIIYLLLVGSLTSISLYASENVPQKKFLALCSAVENKLMTLEEYSGSCYSCEPDANWELTDLEATLQKEQLEKICERNKRDCRCDLIENHKELLQKYCIKDQGKIRLIDLFSQQEREIDDQLLKRMHSYYSHVATLSDAATIPIPNCQKEIETKLSPRIKSKILSKIEQFSHKKQSIQEFLQFPYSGKRYQIDKNLKEKVKEILEPKIYCQKLLQHLNESSYTISALYNKKNPYASSIVPKEYQPLFQCMYGKKTRKKGGIRISQNSVNADLNINLLSSNLNTDVIALIALLPEKPELKQLLADHPTKLYGPDGSEILGKNLEEKIENHRKSWVTYSLEKLTPLYLDLDRQIEQMMATKKAQGGKLTTEQQEELDDLRAQKQEVSQALNEIKDFSKETIARRDERNKKHSTVAKSSNHFSNQNNFSSPQRSSTSQTNYTHSSTPAWSTPTYTAPQKISDIKESVIPQETVHNENLKSQIRSTTQAHGSKDIGKGRSIASKEKPKIASPTFSASSVSQGLRASINPSSKTSAVEKKYYQDMIEKSKPVYIFKDKNIDELRAYKLSNNKSAEVNIAIWDSEKNIFSYYELDTISNSYKPRVSIDVTPDKLKEMLPPKKDVFLEMTEEGSYSQRLFSQLRLDNSKMNNLFQ